MQLVGLAAAEECISGHPHYVGGLTLTQTFGQRFAAISTADLGSIPSWIPPELLQIMRIWPIRQSWSHGVETSLWSLAPEVEDIMNHTGGLTAQKKVIFSEETWLRRLWVITGILCVGLRRLNSGSFPSEYLQGVPPICDSSWCQIPSYASGDTKWEADGDSKAGTSLPSMPCPSSVWKLYNYVKGKPHLSIYWIWC